VATQVGNVIFQISADLKGLQGQLRTMEGNFSSSFSRIEGFAGNLGKGLLQGLAAGFSVGAITSFGREILNLADNLQNLSDQTGLSVELLSGLKSPLEEAGTSMDAFAKGVFNLQKNLGNVDKETDPAAQAIKRLGLNLNELRNASPDQFIKQVTDAIAKIENPVERNTVLFNLLGKSAKELGPAFQQLAGRFDELKASGLTAADVKALDDVGDALTRLKNQALLLGAEGVTSILRFFGAVRDVPKLGADLAAATEKAARLFNLPKERIEGMTSTEIIRQAEVPTRQADLEPRRRARDELLNLREEFNKVNQAAAQVPTAPFKGVSTSAKSATTDVKNLADGFLEGLSKQLDNINSKKLELQFGPEAVLIANLNGQFEALKEKLGAKIKAFPGLEEFFTVLRDKIVEADRGVRQLKQDLENAPNLAAWDALDKEFGTLLANIGKTTPEMAKLQAQLRTQAEELSKTLTLERRGITLEGLSPELRAEAEKGFDLSKRLDEIKKWRTDMVNAGGDAAQAQIDASVLAGQAWDIFFNKQKEQADEQSEFTRRAFERGFDAVSDAFKDFLDNGFTSFQDGKKILRVINSIVADQITLELKKIFLGPDFGKAGAGVGGILGDLFGLGQKPQSKIGGAFDTEEKIWGQMAGGASPTAAAAGQGAADQAAIAAIQAQSATAQTTIEALSGEAQASLQAVSAEGQAVIQAAGATAETGLSTLQSTGIASIEAVKDVAIAEIQAAASSSGGSGIPGMDMLGGGGGGGFMGLFGGGASSAGGGAATSTMGGAFDAFELAMWHQGGPIYPGGGSSSGRARIAFKMHSGGDVPIMAQSGEFMVKRWSANEVGRPALDFINKTGKLPGASGGGPVNINFSVNGANDFESFKRSRPQILADLTRAVQKGQKHL
jgi:hypothetical protein